ncbi:MAG: alpha/beta fold hydrolase [Planctomycetaceae bacterium]
MSRFGITLATLIAVLASATSANAQTKDAEDVRLTTPRGVRLAATYFEASKGKESPVIVMLHGEGGNRKKWSAIAGGLQNTGYAVLTVDLRKHGDSEGVATEGDKSSSAKLKPADYQGMYLDDMEAVKQFLMEKHHGGELNIRKTGFVAVGAIGAVALGAAAIDWLRKPYPDGPPSARTPRGQDVQTIVLISPDATVKGMNLNTAIKTAKAGTVKFMVVVGKKDKGKKKSADKLIKQMKGGIRKDEVEERVVLFEFDTKLNGEMMVAKDNRQILELLKRFHDLKLEPIDQPWRDRRSKLDR